MLRKIVVHVAMQPKFYRLFLVLLATISFISYIAFPLFPTYGESNYISENAMTPYNRDPLFKVDQYKAIMDNLQSISSSTNASTLDYIKNFFINRDIVTYTQDFPVLISNGSSTLHQTGRNLIGIIHPSRAQRDECNVIMFNHDILSKKNKAVSDIALSLAFVDLLTSNKDINYLSRNIVVLAYDGRYKQNGKAVLSFLETYLKGNHASLDFRRCGVLRQAVNIDIEDDKFNYVVLMNDGNNGQLNDFDFYMNYNKLLNENLFGSWSLDENLHYETKINALVNDYYWKPLNNLLERITGQPRKNTPIYLTQTLASLKRRMVGRVDETHSYFMDYGCHAVTLKGIKAPDQRTDDIILKLGRTLESTTRANLALQEPLHAGSPLYVTVDLRNHIAIGGYLLPFMLFQAYVIFRSLVNYMLVKKRFYFFKWIWRGVSHVLGGLIIYFLPKLIEKAWNLLSSKEAYYCYDGEELQDEYDMSDILTLIFIGCSVFTIIFLRPLIDKKGCHVFENHIIARAKSYDEQNVLDEEEWNVYFAFLMCYTCMGTSIWLLINLGFGIFGVMFLEPLLTAVRPLSKKNKSNNFVFFTILGLQIYGSFLLMTELETNPYNLLKIVLRNQSRNMYNLWTYISIMFVPIVSMMLEALAFNQINRK